MDQIIKLLQDYLPILTLVGTIIGVLVGIKNGNKNFEGLTQAAKIQAAASSMTADALSKQADALTKQAEATTEIHEWDRARAMHQALYESYIFYSELERNLIMEIYNTRHPNGHSEEEKTKRIRNEMRTEFRNELRNSGRRLPILHATKLEKDYSWAFM